MNADDEAKFLSALDSAIENEDVEAIDETLVRIFKENQQPQVGNLLIRLNDDFEYQEAMWSILHSAESVDKRYYVQELVRVIDSFSTQSQRWVELILTRCLKNPETKIAMKDVIRNSHTVNSKILQQRLRSISDLD